MAKYEIKLDRSGTNADVFISGVIDEDTDFNPHSLEGVSQAKLHLSNVKSINSCGIREWIRWIGTAKNASVQYYECPKIIVDQINMVQGFLPAGGQVQSFFVPYFNEDAGTEKNVLFTFGQEFDEKGVNPPAEVKDESGQAMEMDVVEAKFFKFLKK